MAQDISVPDIGDFESVEIIEVLVKTGDQINKNDPIVTLESDKSSVEVPSPFTGKIIEFVDEDIEKLQKKVAQKLGYNLVDHRLELYGSKTKK